MEHKLNPIASKILSVLIKNEDYMNTTEIAKESKVSWNTALIYLNDFWKKGWVEKEGNTNVYWKAIVY
ncbi:MAG: winged helix-turn-helix domain-containing protein [Nanoarchaeota archaeon]